MKSFLPTELTRDLLKQLSNETSLIDLGPCFPAEKLANLCDLTDAYSKSAAKDGLPKYKAISLQVSSENPPQDDGIHREITDFSGKSTRDYSHWTKLGENFRFMTELLPDFRLSRGRILFLEPGGLVPAHRDEYMGWRLHVPLKTHPNCLLSVDNRKYHLRAGGCAYLLNVFKPHGVENRSNIVRSHVVFVLN